MGQGPIASEIDAKEFVQGQCDSAAFSKIEKFIELLIAENGRQNLIAKTTEAIIWQRHIADSAQCLHYLSGQTTPKVWLDLGSGPGLPGLIIAIMRPDLRMCLVESRKRRYEFLGNMIEEFNLANCAVEGTRLELVKSFKADVISARAFAPLADIFALSARFSTKDSVFVLPKGRGAVQELSDLPKWQRELFHVEQSLTDDESGVIVGRLGQVALRKLGVAR